MEGASISCSSSTPSSFLFLSNQLFKHGRYQESLCIYFTSLVCCWWKTCLPRVLTDPLSCSCGRRVCLCRSCFVVCWQPFEEERSPQIARCCLILARLSALLTSCTTCLTFEYETRLPPWSTNRFHRGLRLSYLPRCPTCRLTAASNCLILQSECAVKSSRNWRCAVTCLLMMADWRGHHLVNLPSRADR